MTIKKMNAVLALAVTILLIDHTTFCSIQLIKHDFSDSSAAPALTLTLLTAIHILISLFLVFCRHDSKFVKYTKHNISTILQRDSGFLTIIIVPFHIAGAIKAIDGNTTVSFLVLQSLLVLFSMIHTAISVPNAFITLGIIRSERAHKAARILCSCICLMLVILSSFGCIMEVMK